MSIRPWEVARSEKCFLYKQEDLSPRSVCVGGGEVIHTCNFSAGEVGTNPSSMALAI